MPRATSPRTKQARPKTARIRQTSADQTPTAEIPTAEIPTAEGPTPEAPAPSAPEAAATPAMAPEAALLLGGTAPTLTDIAATLDVLERTILLTRALMQQAFTAGAPRMLTAAEFAARVGGITEETVNEWCRTRKHGKFARAQNWGRAGWRIPEYYLLYTDDDWARLLRGGARDNPVTPAAAAVDATPAFDVTAFDEVIA